MTVQLNELALQIATFKNEISDLEAQTNVKKEKYQELCDLMLKTLDLADIDSMKAHGYLFYKETKSSVTTPKTVEEKNLLFEFLKEKGIFMEIVSVNSQTLNSLYKNLAQEAAMEGAIDFRLPGVEAPKLYTTLKLKKG